MKTKLNHTPWGLAFDLRGQLCFLVHNTDHRNFSLEKEYEVSLFYRWMYSEEPDKSARNWKFLEGNSEEEILNSEQFKKYNTKYTWGYNEPRAYCKIDFVGGGIGIP